MHDKTKILIACDKFKGSLSAVQVGEAIVAGLPEDWVKVICPIADGGEGFVDAMLAGEPGEKIQVEVTDASGRRCIAEYGLSGRNAFIEMSAASGLWRINADERNPRRASTFGTGLLIRHAAEVSKAERIFVGLGGSATNDGGAGMAAALGVRFFGKDGEELQPVPEALEHLVAVDESNRITLPEIVVACDVDNPLCGDRGASAVYGPQKGASPDDVIFLDGVLRKLAEISGSGDIAGSPGAGAAGGLGFGLMRFAGARLVSGFDLISDVLGLERKIAEADLVITGEGSLDSQTLCGKGPAGVAAMARAAGTPVIAVAGRIEPEAGALFDAALSLQSFGLPKEESIARASELVRRIVAENGTAVRQAAFSRNGGKSR